jgi:broad specificity phosphatase PhoE
MAQRIILATCARRLNRKRPSFIPAHQGEARMPNAKIPPVHLLVVRHGQQTREGQDGPLTSLGREQVARTAVAIGLTSQDRLVSSTRRRAVQTATAFGREPEQIADLDEFRFGESWSWADADEREDLLLWRPEHSAPGGETLGEFQERVSRALDELTAHPPEGRIIVVVHAGVIDATLRWVYGLGPESPWTTEVRAGQASITELEFWPRGRGPREAPRHSFLLRVGDVSHFPPELVTGL